MNMKQRTNSRSFTRRHRHMKIPLLLVALLLLGAFVFYLLADRPEDTDDAIQEQTQTLDNDEAEDEAPILELPSVQSELDAVLGTVRGTHSVLVEDPLTGDVLASHRINETYFTASIYKLYVAYMGLQDIQSGLYDPNESYNQGRTRMECIEVMLRDSDSPCPEQMWEEQGRATGNERLAELGLTNTDLLDISTTVHDANTILERLYAEKDLSEEYAEVLRENLRDFAERDFRQGLPSAFDEVGDIMVYNKPGLYDEGWLDAAMIELPNGRTVIVSIFSDNAYYQEVRTIADAIISPLIEASR
jgi:hypothetical protein